MPAVLSKRILWYPLVLAGIAFFAVAGIRASAATLAVSTSSLPDGELTVAYSKQLNATGGTQPYTTWQIVGGVLPTGISLSASGLLSGTPTAAGTFNITVRVTDSASPAATADRALTLIVRSALTITTTTLPNAQVGVPYSQTLQKSGGVAPVTWSMISGGLGDLTLNTSTGVISGTPTSTAGLVFTVRATDSLGATDDQALTIIVNPANTLAITTASLPNGSTGTAYSQTIAAVGGTTPYVWTLFSGTLPPGLNLTSGASTPWNGSLSGTPTTAGSYTFTVKVMDTAGTPASATREYTVVINQLAISTASFPDGVVGTAYSKTLQGTGGTGTYTWSIVAGSLPGGLSLSGAVVSGTPTVVGTSTFTVQLGDGTQTVTKVFAIDVKAAGTVLPNDDDDDDDDKLHGLCNAYNRGSDQGVRMKREHGRAFQNLGETCENRRGDLDDDDDDDDDEQESNSQRGKGKGKPEQSQGANSGKGKGKGRD